MDPSFLDDSPIAVVITDLKHHIKYANSAACILLNDTIEHLMGFPLYAFVSEESREDLSVIFEDPETNPQGEGYFQLSKNENIPVRIHVSADKNVLCWYLENRKEIISLKKEMDALRSLPREYGHDINNLLTVILSAAQMMQYDIEENNPLHEDLNDILDAGQRAAAQTRLFMNLGRRLVINPKTFCINDLIRKIMPLLRDLLGKAELNVELCAEQGLIHGPEISVQASISHLFAHARFLRTESNFILQTEIVDIEGHFAHNVAGLANGKYIVVTLRESDFHFHEEMHQTGDFFEPDIGDALSLAWEGMARSRGTIIQRVDNYKKSCVSLYFPEITALTSV